MSDISIKLDPAVVEEAARSIDQNAQPAPARYGHLGGCCSCHESILSHFDTAGRFLGCTAVPEGTVFVLMAVPARAGAGRTAADPSLPPSARPLESDPAPSATDRARTRQFQRARYFLTKPLDDLTPRTPLQRKFLRALAGHETTGFTVSDLIEDMNVPNNTAQAAIRWAKKLKAIQAQEDDEG